ncbi:MAG: glycoside hydrolase [Acidobacteriia bacterium]|nr:glycoside hydrolase [Terriglobia bacterium]
MNGLILSSPQRRSFIFLAAVLVLAFLAPGAQAQFTLRKISVDTFTNTSSQHKSEVEPDTFAFGSTIVSAFQVARIFSGGGADIGFATSTDGGNTWVHGYLPGLTVNYKGGAFSAASDASVAYDAKHGQWLISALPLSGVADVSVSRSPDGIHWGRPIAVDRSGGDDKNWIVCDNTATSPFFGNCYSEWDTPTTFMSTSTDGGLTWGPAKSTADHAIGVGGQPLVQPNGTVVVPIAGGTGLIAFTSTDGGATWGRTTTISNVIEHGESGGLRSAGLPSAEIDATGKIYVVWSDCRFRSGCSTNDLVLSTSTDGTTWTAPSRIPIDPTTSTVDHFIPGLGVDPNTAGTTAHLALTYYYYPVSQCGNSCQLDVGFVLSDDGGNTWTAGKQLAGPMQLSWLPNTFSGLMVADYLSTSYVNGNPFGVFVVARAPSGGVLNQAAFTTTTPLLASADEPRFSSRGDKPVPNAKSDFVRKYYDDEWRFPIPPPKKHLKK